MVLNSIFLKGGKLKSLTLINAQLTKLSSCHVLGAKTNRRFILNAGGTETIVEPKSVLGSHLCLALDPRYTFTGPHFHTQPQDLGGGGAGRVHLPSNGQPLIEGA